MSKTEQKNEHTTCGACGYDGGFAHEREKNNLTNEFNKAYSQLEHQLVEAKTDTPAVKEVRNVVWGIVVGLCTLMMSVTYCETRPPDARPPANPEIVKIESVKEAYVACLQHSSHVQGEQRAQILNQCNVAFKNEFDKLRIEKVEP